MTSLKEVACQLSNEAPSVRKLVSNGVRHGPKEGISNGVLHNDLHTDARRDKCIVDDLSTSASQGRSLATRDWERSKSPNHEVLNGQPASTLVESTRAIHEHTGLDRCDLTGLARDGRKYQLAFSSDTYVRQSEEQAVITVEHPTIHDSRAVTETLCGSFVVLFALHKLYHVYGGGEHTIVGFLADGNDIIPTVLHHEELWQRSCVEAVLEVRKQTRNVCLSQPGQGYKPILYDSILMEDGKASQENVSRPLVFSFTEADLNLQLTATYDSNLFTESTVRDFLDVMHKIIQSISEDPNSLVADIEFLSPSIKTQLDLCNNTDGDFPKDKRLNNLIEDAVDASPDKVALIYKDLRLTYRQLNEQANRLAYYLHSVMHVAPEELVALLLDKSEAMIITVIAVWKSGAAYTPIDPAYPDERIRFALSDTQAKIVLVNECHLHRLSSQIVPDSNLRIMAIEPLLKILSNDVSIPCGNLNIGLRSNQLAYLTYTSGTTGVPKGIYKEHRSVVNSITNLAERYGVKGSPREVILLFAAYVFEPFVRQTLMALINSQTLAIIDDIEKLDPKKLTAFVKEHAVTYLNGTASVIQEFNFSDCPSLQRLILVGEDLTQTRYKELRRLFKHRIINEYGFTESAFVTALKTFDADSKRTNRSLGRPLRNVKWYVLNKALRQVPIGAIGELHIGGIGVSRGYMNRPELTKQKFLQNPFQTPHEREEDINGLIYKTGDLARVLPDGEVEYLGRNDFQIKLRGLRIEPGEIEAVLSHYPGVRTSVVVARELKGGQHASNSKHLVGFFVSNEGVIAESDLIDYLETQLPRYMIPTRIVQLPRIKTNVNGKVDLRALPEVDLAAITSTSAQGAMRSDLDIQLRKIWSRILGVPRDRIGVDDNFFRLGGHSITCIQLLGSIRSTIQVEINVEDVFSAKTLGRLSDLIWKRRESGHGNSQTNGVTSGISFQVPSSVPEGEVERCFLANSLQQGFVYRYLKHDENTEVDSPYIMQTTCTYHCQISQDVFKLAWESLQRRYSCLRMGLAWESEILQIIMKNGTLNWSFIDNNHITDLALQDQAIRDVLSKDKQKPFQLERGSLFRVYLVKLAKDKFCCIFSCHHAILDGWSLPLLLQSLHTIYLQLLSHSPPALALDHSYIDAQQYLQNHRHDNIEYWSNRIKEINERCDLNALLNEKSRYKVPLESYDTIYEQREKTILVKECWTPQLREICSVYGVTLHSILQFLWHSVLHAYGGGAQTVVGTIVSGRNLPVDGIDECIGLLINTLPLIVHHASQTGESVITAITGIQEQVNAMNTRSNVALSSVLDGKLKHGLFDTLFVLENYPNLDKSDEEAQQKLLNFKINGETEKLDYPLAVVARESKEGDGFSFTICYESRLFEDSIIEDLLQTVESLFRQIAADPSRPVSDLEHLGVSQLQQLDKWNSNETGFPDQSTLHEIFEQEVVRVPEKYAVIHGDVKLTYSSMNAQANRLARFIQDTVNIQTEQLVALFMDKSDFMMVSIFAIWKAGAAYVPIDPSYPDDRIQYILGDTGAKMILTDFDYAPRLHSLFDKPIAVVDNNLLCSLKHDESNPGTICLSTNLAYIIYTSGTTGKPKGVMIEHRGVVNLQASLSKLFGLRTTGDDEVILTFSNYVFDHFIEVMTDALLNGQTMLILNDAMRTDKERLYKYMNDNRVTYLSGTPSVISVYEYESFPHLRRIDCIGEAFSETVFNRIRSSFDGLIINGYGPTEISITSHKRLYPRDEPRKDQSIGKQIANTTSYVLDENMKLVPVGAVGELYIGGIGVARGYHNRADLSSERFPVNPFQSERERQLGINGRLYKTGDLVRWLPQAGGEIEYLGRNDFQVKIRGIRIELGEIEGVLSSYPGVRKGVVAIKEQASQESSGTASSIKYLVGYYVSPTSLQEHDIKSYMASKLPEYMVPNRIVPIYHIPVTISGKLDTKKLPTTSYALADDYIAPRNEIELQLSSIWSDLLGIPSDKVGIQDDFFSLGGDSLLSTKLSFLISKAFIRQVNVATLFKHRTIESLAHFIMYDADDSQSIPKLEDPMISIPVSLAQERLLFINEFEGGTDAYNIVKNFKIHSDVSLKSLREALWLVVDRHKALRTLLIRSDDDSKFHQMVIDEAVARKKFFIKETLAHDISDVDQGLVRQSRHIFDLSEELPIRVNIFLVDGKKSSSYMSLVLHHTCFDGWSWNIFQRDLESMYRFVEGTMSIANLNPVVTQYADFSKWQRSRFSGERKRVLTRFWKDKLEGFHQLSLLPDYPRPSRFNYEGRDLRFTVDPTTTSSLRGLAKSLKISLHSLLVAAYGLMLSTYSGQDDLVIGIPVANRGHPELEGIIGFFVDMIVLRIPIVRQATVQEYLQTVSHELIQAQLHQEMPFQEVVKTLGIQSDPSRHPIVQAIFNLGVSEATSDSSDQSHLQLHEYEWQSSEYTTSKFDLSATIMEDDAILHGNFNYPVQLFAKESMRNLTRTYTHLLRQLGGLDLDNVTKLAQLNLVYEDPEVIPCLSGQNYPMFNVGTLKSLFEDQIANSGNEIAIIHNNVQLSYNQLNARANQLAWQLLAVVDLKPNDVVALVLNKSEFTVLAILAVIKTGAAYVPIDSQYPAERKRFILKDTTARVIITNEKCQSEIDALACGTPIIAIDSEASTANIQGRPTSNLPPSATDRDLAYIIYTSGTTGNPKGVMVEHHSVVTLAQSLNERYFGDGSQNQTLLLLSNYVFDFSVEQLLLSIFSSNRLLIPASELTLDDTFYDALNKAGLSYLSGTPSLLQQIDLSRIETLRIVTSAGEEMHPHHYKKMRSEFNGLIYNAYGITETTVYNMVNCFTAESEFENNLGTILPNTKAFILSEDMQILPRGAVGELYLAGYCVARGYLNREGLNSQRFISNPYRLPQEAEGGLYPTLYKTGDLVRQRHNGTLEYLGRNDQQVKIRGFRVEIGEITAAIMAIQGVRQAAVVPQKTKSNLILVAYYVTDNVNLTDEIIFSALRTRLPHFMIPSQIVRLKKDLPVTVNGKLDVRALPEFDVERRDSGSFARPSNQTEFYMHRIWGSVLGIDDFCMTDDFYKLGGDSIVSLQLVNRIRNELKLKVTVKDIFDHRSVRSLCDYLFTSSKVTEEVAQISEQGRISGEVPLLPIQEWFFSKNLVKRDHWNQYFCINAPELDINRLKEALAVLIDYHDAFRLRYTAVSEGMKQSYVDEPMSVNIQVISTEDPGFMSDKWQASLDLEKGPLHSVRYVKGDQAAQLWLAFHHLIVDTVSWRILIRDLQALYEGKSLGQKYTSYRQWATKIREYPYSDAERMYWHGAIEKTRLAGAPLDTLPLTKWTSHSVFLDTTQTGMLLRSCPNISDTTVVELLLSATAIALHNITGNPTNSIVLESHGRGSPDYSLNVGSTMGWFTAIYPFSLEATSDLSSTIQMTRENYRRVPNNGLGYGVLHGYVKPSLPRITFNYLGQFKKESNSTTEWTLSTESGAFGLSSSTDNQSANDALLDITAICLGDRMTFEISSRLGAAADISELFLHQMESVIQHIQSQSALTPQTLSNGSTDYEFIPYFEFKPSISNSRSQPLFLLPPGEGGAESYFNNVVQKLSPDHHLVVFNNHYLHDGSAPLNTFEALAAYYLRFIKKLQPGGGPYHLLGWSFGGILAFEIARQLARDNPADEMPRVATLGLLDPYFCINEATEAIGLSGETDILDPIHSRYEVDNVPARLAGRIVLFKAPRMNERWKDDRQKRLYAFYRAEDYNLLDRLVERSLVEKVVLDGETHFSWVRNEAQVGKVAEVMRSCMSS